MTLATLVMITPIIMMVTTSFKTMEEIKSPVFHLLPEKFSFVNYIDALNGANWVIYFRNSVFITLAAVLFSILFNSISGFAFARLKFKGPVYVHPHRTDDAAPGYHASHLPDHGKISSGRGK